MAEDLIEGMTSAWKPEQYKDTYYQDVMKTIQRKVKAGRGNKIAAPEREEKIKTTDNVVDLVPLLQKSLQERSKKKARTRSRTSA